MVAMNNKEHNSKEYCAYRLLQSNDYLAPMYRERIRGLVGVRGAIIFPESLFSVSSNVYSVAIIRDTSGHRIGMNIIASRPRLFHGNTEVTTLEQALEIEANVASMSEIPSLFRLPGAGYGNERYFFDNPLFSNQKAVLKWVYKNLPAALGSIKG